MSFLIQNNEYMKTAILSLLSILFISSNIFAQKVQFEWATSFGGKYEDQGKSIVVDDLGNIYTTGYIQDTVDLNPDAQIFDFHYPYGYRDVYISKFDSSGKLISAISMGACDWDQGNSLTIDDFGNIYSIGNFNDTIDFDPGPGVYDLSSNGSSDFFITKYDSSLNFVWAKSIGGNYIFGDAGYSIAIDTFGNVYTTGCFNGTVDFDPGAGIYELTARGLTDIFISKLDNFGNFVWARNIGYNEWNQGNSLVCDYAGNVYVTGFFSGTIDFNTDTVETFYLSSNGGYDIFVLKLDKAGKFKWAHSMGGVLWDESHSVDIDARGNIYLTGRFSSIVDFDPDSTEVYTLSSSGSFDIFILKLDSLGNFVWAKNIGGNSEDTGYSLKLDTLGNIYSTGFYSGAVDFDPGFQEFELSIGGCYFLKLDSNGTFIWAAGIGGNADDHGNSINIDSDGNVYSTGFVWGGVDLDPTAGEFYTSTVNGSKDVFILKLSQRFPDINEISETNFLPEISIYPNPAKDFTQIDFGNNYFSGSVEILGISGQVFINRNFTNSQKIDINIQNLAYGIYFARIVTTDNQMFVQKFVKI